MADDPKARQESIGNFLRRDLGGPPRLRTRLALIGGAGLLAGSRLEGWIRDDERFPVEMPMVLNAVLILRHFAMSPDALRRLRDDVQAMADVVAGEWGGTGVLLAKEDPDLAAFRTVDRRIGEIETAVREAERCVEEAQYRWNWRSRHLETPTGARPRQLLTDLVRACLLGLVATTNSQEVRDDIASELAPFFPVDMLKTSRGSTLYGAVDNALRGS